MPDITNPAHRANKRRASMDWLRLLVQVPDPDLQAHCANLIFWDYLSGGIGQKRASPMFREIMDRKIDYSRLTQPSVATTLKFLGYCDRMIRTRSPSMYFPKEQPGPAPSPTSATASNPASRQGATKSESRNHNPRTNDHAIPQAQH